jgi:hypothetical protein
MDSRLHPNGGGSEDRSHVDCVIAAFAEPGVHATSDQFFSQTRSTITNGRREASVTECGYAPRSARQYPAASSTACPVLGIRNVRS